MKVMFRVAFRFRISVVRVRVRDNVTVMVAVGATVKSYFARVGFFTFQMTRCGNFVLKL